MARPARLTLLLLLTLGAVPATGPSLPALIDRLGDADPAVRQTAYDALDALVRVGRLAPATSPAIRAALHSPKPGIADAAASLILAGYWFAPDDAQSVRLLLMGYGRQNADGRVEILQNILQHHLPGGSKAVVRVAALDPSDDVAWAIFDDRGTPQGPLDADAEAAIAALDPASRPAGLTVVLARALAARNDLAALPMIRGVLEREHRRPTASPGQIASAVKVLADAESRQGDATAAAIRIRELLQRPNDAGDRVGLVDQILALQACHGPLPGLAGDLAAADTDAESHSASVLAEIARRTGMPTAAGLLLGAMIPEQGKGETPVDRTARLSEAADWLITAGGVDAACRVYEHVAAIDTEPTRGRVVNAWYRLAVLHEQAGRYGLAGDAIQHLLARENDALTLTRNGQPETWSVEDQQAKAYWCYLLDALARGDSAAAATQAKNLIKSGSTDDNVFLSALAQLDAVAEPGQVDAYFDRVFERAKGRMAEYPDQPVWANDIAWLCVRSGRRLPEATAWAERAVNAAPHEAAYLDTLAEIRFRTGHAREAVDLETQAIAQHPDEESFMQRQLERFTAAAATQPAK